MSKRNMTAHTLDEEQAPSQPAPVQPPRTVLDLPTALSLYGLTDSELFWELQTDTRCLMGWSQEKIVVSFRGTASMKNAVADMQVIGRLPCALQFFQRLCLYAECISRHAGHLQTALCILTLKGSSSYSIDLSTAFDLHCYIDCMLKVSPIW